MAKILIIEDDTAVREGLLKVFRDENFKVITADSGEKGIKAVENDFPDIIILDVMLPGMSGFETLKKLRNAKVNTPLMLLTARNEDMDKILGLELGADDYVTKPFNPREVVARARALLRRIDYANTSENADVLRKMSTFEFGNVFIDFERHEATKSKKEITFTHREFRLLKHFIENPNKLITRDTLLKDVWEYDSYDTSHVTTRTVDNHILRLRKKIEDDPEKPQFIQTIRGYGYKFTLE